MAAEIAAAAAAGVAGAPVDGPAPASPEKGNDTIMMVCYRMEFETLMNDLNYPKIHMERSKK